MEVRRKNREVDEARGTDVLAVEKKVIRCRSVPRRENVTVVEKGAILPERVERGAGRNKVKGEVN